MKNRFTIVLSSVLMFVLLSIFATMMASADIHEETVVETTWLHDISPRPNASGWITHSNTLIITNTVSDPAGIVPNSTTVIISPDPGIDIPATRVIDRNRLEITQRIENLREGESDLIFSVVLSQSLKVVSDTVHLKKDSFKPTVTVTNPVENASVEGKVLIYWEVTDPVPSSGSRKFAKIGYSLNNSTDVMPVSDTAESPFEWRFPAGISGTVNLHVTGFDIAGNRETTMIPIQVKPPPKRFIYMPIGLNKLDYCNPDEDLRDCYELNETNNDFSTATRLTETGNTYTAVISDANDLDLYRILFTAATGPTIYTITLTYTGNSDLDLYVYDLPVFASPLKYSVNPPCSTSSCVNKEEIPILIGTTRDLLVFVRPYKVTNTPLRYQLSITP